MIPVLVDGAAMPDRDELPPALHGLVRRHAVQLNHVTFRSDVGRLLDAVEHIPPASRPDGPVEDPPAAPAQAVFERGERLEEQGDRADAMDAYRQAVDADDPEFSPAAAYAMGRITWHEGKPLRGV